MFRVFRYRLYPTAAQQERLEAVLETCRRFYNDCLEERKATYEEEGRTIGKVEQLRRVKIHKANNPYAATVHSHVLQVVVTDLDKAFRAFFRRVKAGEKPGYPRFKGQHRFHSFGFKEEGNGFKIDGRRLRLSGIGRVAVRWHRPLEGTIKTLRITRKADKWYAAFSCAVESRPLPSSDQEVGIDTGLSSLFVLSTGEHIDNPRWYRSSQRKLRVLQRAVARKRKGSMNRRKAVSALARFSEHVANQRKDFLNKLVSTLVGAFGRIAVEDLLVSRMVHGNLAKSILDAGWGFFKQRLLAKAESAGRVVALVDPAYTTQNCCQCGHRQKLSLKDRWYSCPCGNSRHRDENAALNILAAGRAVWAPSLALAGLAQEAVPL
ncbi:MAG: transposase [Patescibacteria group bacterium]|nr:transposase [Patescibacteria group bacterium]